MMFPGKMLPAAKRCTMNSYLILSGRSIQRSNNKPSRFPIRKYMFASSEYASCFRNLPKPDTQALKVQTLEYLESFDETLWYDDPISSIVQGRSLMVDDDDDDDSTIETTVNGLGVPNGRQRLASRQQVTDIIRHHICTFPSTTTPNTLDLRKEIRAIEDRMVRDDHAGFLIGNQCLDFGKQDGVSELEESIMVNAVERRYNDLLLRDEEKGIVSICRKPIYVVCVSSSSNFLDLFRKTMRSLEVGIPCIVLSRTHDNNNNNNSNTNHTAQHSYRWCQLLVSLCKEHGVDPGMVTFVSCSREDMQDLVRSCKDFTGNLYATCSRDAAVALKASYANTVASTSGPNTLVVAAPSNTAAADDDNNSNAAAAAAALTVQVADAIQSSATIESAGTCTALRHCVVPPSAVGGQELEAIFEETRTLSSSGPEVLTSTSIGDGVFVGHNGTDGPPSRPSTAVVKTDTDAAYTHFLDSDVYVKLSDEFPSTDIQEYWRKVVVDFTAVDLMGKDGKCDTDNVKRLVQWLNATQPISLAINGPRQDALELGLELFEQTSLFVNTIGSSDNPEMPPALTCQSRPQDGEIFGHVPPRQTLHQYTKYPVVIPSSNPSYDTHYTEEYLTAQTMTSTDFSPATRQMIDQISTNAAALRGYCMVLIRYLQNVSRQNPKQGLGHGRTSLYGVQRPPVNSKTVLICPDGTTWDTLAPVFLLFYCTNARDQLDLWIDVANDALIVHCNQFKIPYTLGVPPTVGDGVDQDAFSANRVILEPSAWSQTPRNYILADRFVSRFFPFGHIKSTMKADDEFVFRGTISKKWINTLF